MRMQPCSLRVPGAGELSLAVMLVIVGAGGSLYAQTSAGPDFREEFRSQSGQNSADYVPGSSQIEENEILRRMERELGQPFTPRLEREALRTRAARRQARRGIPGGPVAYAVELELGGTERRVGRILLGQRTLQLREALAEGQEIRHRVPLKDVASIEFLKWKAVRVHAARPTGEEPGGTKSAVKVLFFPSVAALTRRDGQRVQGQLEAFDWLQLHLFSVGNAYGRYQSYYGVSPENLPAAAESTESDASNGKEAAGVDLQRLPEQAADQAPAEIVRAIRFQTAEGIQNAENDPDAAESDQPDGDNSLDNESVPGAASAPDEGEGER